MRDSVEQDRGICLRKRSNQLKMSRMFLHRIRTDDFHI